VQVITRFTLSIVMKLLTYLQTAQWMSRRAITALIKQQAIRVNDQIVESFWTLLQEGDVISRWAKPVTFTWATKWQTTQHIVLFNKPCGYVVSKSDPHNQTIFELLPTWRTKSYYPIGRLDKESSGLLILSNDPKLVHELLHPSKKCEKVYKVLIKQEWSPELSALTRAWCIVDEQGYTPTGKEQWDLLKFKKISHQRTLEWPTMLSITIQEGKKRHIRRLLKFLWYTIISLHRISFGKWNLGDLAEGKWKEVGENE
jgi:pseudouridine synthase